MRRTRSWPTPRPCSRRWPPKGTNSNAPWVVRFPDAMAGWSAAQYARATREHLASLQGRAAVGSAARRCAGPDGIAPCDRALQRLGLDREDLEQRRANGLAAREKEFEAWL